jgi:hypothetical protein
MATDIGSGSRKSRTRRSLITGRKIEPTNRHHGYSAKQLVMFAIDRFVRDDHAGLKTLANGEFELRLFTGEIFHLGDKTITRIA